MDTPGPVLSCHARMTLSTQYAYGGVHSMVSTLLQLKKKPRKAKVRTRVLILDSSFLDGHGMAAPQCHCTLLFRIQKASLDHGIDTGIII